LCELLKYSLFRYVSDKMFSILPINYTNMCTGFLKLDSDTSSNSLSATSDNNYFIFEILHITIINSECKYTKK